MAEKRLNSQPTPRTVYSLNSKQTQRNLTYTNKCWIPESNKLLTPKQKLHIKPENHLQKLWKSSKTHHHSHSEPTMINCVQTPAKRTIQNQFFPKQKHIQPRNKTTMSRKSRISFVSLKKSIQFSLYLRYNVTHPLTHWKRRRIRYVAKKGRRENTTISVN